MDVNPGCTAFVEGQTFLSALMPEASVESIATVFLEDFLETWNFSVSRMEKELDSFETCKREPRPYGSSNLGQT